MRYSYAQTSHIESRPPTYWYLKQTSKGYCLSYLTLLQHGCSLKWESLLPSFQQESKQDLSKKLE